MYPQCRECHPFNCYIKTLIILLMLSSITLLNAETMRWAKLEVGTDIYINAYVSKVTESGVGIIHSEGAATIPWSKFSEEDQTKLGLPAILEEKNKKIEALASIKAAEQEEYVKAKKSIRAGQMTLVQLQEALKQAYAFLQKSEGKHVDWQRFIFEMLGKPDSVANRAKTYTDYMGQPANRNSPIWTWDNFVGDTITNRKHRLTINSDGGYKYGWYGMEANGEELPLILE